MPSLRCMFFDKWLHKGQITQEEYDAAIKKLDGHNKQLRIDTIDECINTLDDYIKTPMTDEYVIKECIDVLKQLKEKNDI